MEERVILVMVMVSRVQVPPDIDINDDSNCVDVVDAIEISESRSVPSDEIKDGRFLTEKTIRRRYKINVPVVTENMGSVLSYPLRDKVA